MDKKSVFADKQIVKAGGLLVTLFTELYAVFNFKNNGMAT